VELFEDLQIALQTPDRAAARPVLGAAILAFGLLIGSTTAFAAAGDGDDSASAAVPIHSSPDFVIAQGLTGALGGGQQGTSPSGSSSPSGTTTAAEPTGGQDPNAPAQPPLGPTTPLGGVQGGASAPTTPTGSGLGPTTPLGGVQGGASAPTPPATSGLGPTAPLGGGTAQPVAGANNCGTASGAGAGCGEAPTPMTSEGCEELGDVTLTALDEVLGDWTNDRGEKITIRQQAGGKSTDLVWDGKRRWEGSFEGGKLRFTRRPAAGEMGDAPDWARDLAVQQRLTWELELEAKSECGQPVLVGKWYPGTFKWSEKVDAGGSPDLASRQVTDIGRGDPIEVRYTQPPMSIVGVAVLEKQTREEKLGEPSYVYPFQPGADDTGAALTTRTLYVYGINLPTTRDRKIVVTSDDPNIEYLVLSVKRDWELNAGEADRAKLGLAAAKAALSFQDAPRIDKMPALLLRARLRSGSGTPLLPGMKSFTINGVAASWQLRFGDDNAHISFARAANNSPVPPVELALDNVEPTQFLFKPERFFIQVQIEAPLPLESIALRVGVDDKKITWNGSATIVAKRVPGTTTLYRTPAIELIAPGAVPADPAGAYYLPTDGGRIFAALDNPWLLRHAPGIAKLLSGPGDLGHTFKYYLRRAATADNVSPMPDLSTDDGWRQLTGKTATTITNVALLTGYFGGKARPRTWKQWLIETFVRQNHPAGQYNHRSDDVILSVRVSVAEHAALLLLRDVFVAKMNAATTQFEALLKAYEEDNKSAGMRGLRDYLKIVGWNEDQVWRRLEVSCPGTPGGVGQAKTSASSCLLPHALSDDFLERAFPNDRVAADIWSISATAQGVRTLLGSAREARDKAKGLADSDVEGMIKILGRNYEPLLVDLSSRLMTTNEDGKWIPDLGARYSLLQLHQLTDAVVAQQELATADAVAVIKLALVPLIMMAGPALVVEEAMATEVVSWGLYATDSVVDVADAYFKLPDVKFALGASLALGAEQLARAEAERRQIVFGTLETLAVAAAMNYGGNEIVPRVLAVGKSAAQTVGRPVLAAIRKGGLAVFKKLEPKIQEAVLALILRGKSVEQEGALAYAGAFERDAAAVGDQLAAEAGAAKPAPPAEAPIAAVGEPDTVTPKLEIEVPRLAEYEGEVYTPKVDLEVPGSPAGEGDIFIPIDSPEVPVQPAPRDPVAERLAADWERAPASGSDVRLMDAPGGTAQPYLLGNRLGKPGLYVWALELKEVGGQKMASPTVLKLAGRSIDRSFSGAEMVENSAKGYQLITERTDIPVLKTTFHPQGVEVLADGSTRPMPFMLQEHLGKRRLTLKEIVDGFGGQDKLPEGLQRQIAEVWGKLLKGGLYPTDLNWNNLYVELMSPQQTWPGFFRSGNASIRVGILDFDRTVLYSDYLAHRCGKMGQFFGETIELFHAIQRLGSMSEVYSRPQNVRFIKRFRTTMGNLKDPSQQIAFGHGPFWPDDLAYSLEKMAEFQGLVKFDRDTGRLVKGMVEPQFFRDAGFGEFGDSSRFTPFPLSRAGGGTAVSQPRRRRPTMLRPPARTMHRGVARRAPLPCLLAA